MKTKDALINLKVSRETRDELKAVASLRGLSVSALLHQFIFKTVREEKERDMRMFEEAADEVVIQGVVRRIERDVM